MTPRNNISTLRGDVLVIALELIVRCTDEINKYFSSTAERQRNHNRHFCALMILWLYNRVSIFTTLFSTPLPFLSSRLHHLLLQIIVIVQVCKTKTMANSIGRSCSTACVARVVASASHYLGQLGRDVPTSHRVPKFIWRLLPFFCDWQRK